MLRGILGSHSHLFSLDILTRLLCAQLLCDNRLQFDLVQFNIYACFNSLVISCMRPQSIPRDVLHIALHQISSGLILSAAPSRVAPVNFWFVGQQSNLVGAIPDTLSFSGDKAIAEFHVYK